MIREQPGYRSYLLRLWLVKQNDEQTWRASLEDPRTQQKRLFPSLDALCEFLRTLETVRVEFDHKNEM